MPLIGVPGTIVDPSDGNVQWKIPDDRHQENKIGAIRPGFYLRSPIFTFLKRSWYFRLYPNGHEINQKCFSVFLCVIRSTPEEDPLTLNISLHFCLDNVDESIIERKIKIFTFSFSNAHHTLIWTRFLKSSLIWDKDPWSSPITISCFATKDHLPMFTFYRSMSRKTDLSEVLKKMYDDKRDADVTLVVTCEDEERSFLAHKLILGARSWGFGYKFDSDKNCNTFDFHDYDPDAFETLLQFLYTGTLKELTLDEVMDLYDVAYYFCRYLAGICARFLAHRITVDTYKEICDLAETYGDKFLRQATRRFYEANMAMDDADG